MAQEGDRFADRVDAGRVLGATLAARGAWGDAIVLGLPRGGVPVAAEVARALRLPLDVFVVRKLGVPGHEELAMGAIASGGVRVLNQPVVAAAGVSAEALEEVTRREQLELDRREQAYRGQRPPPVVRGRTTIVVDDGLATGSTMRAAIQALRRAGAARVVAAVPVAPAETCRDLGPEVDELVCPLVPKRFRAVGLWYRDFEAPSDGEVAALLAAERV